MENHDVRGDALDGFELVRAEVTTSARLWKQLGIVRGILLHLRLRVLHAMGVQPDRLARMYPTSES